MGKVEGSHSESEEVNRLEQVIMALCTINTFILAWLGLLLRIWKMDEKLVRFQNR